jgi:uncharacterized coiled-coil protein SlyX
MKMTHLIERAVAAVAAVKTDEARAMIARLAELEAQVPEQAAALAHMEEQLTTAWAEIETLKEARGTLREEVETAREALEAAQAQARTVEDAMTAELARFGMAAEELPAAAHEDAVPVDPQVARAAELLAEYEAAETATEQAKIFGKAKSAGVNLRVYALTGRLN